MNHPVKYAREIKVGILFIVCVFLLIFGFNYLKGVNIFSSVLGYRGVFANVNGLTEQSPVYVRGYKVGQVDAIHYDFTKDSAFIIDISIKSDIHLPHGTCMALVSDGLLGGSAIELQIPEVPVAENRYHRGDFLPTVVVPGVLETMQTGLLKDVDKAVLEAQSLLENIKMQLADDHLKNALTNIDSISVNLTGASSSIDRLMTYRVPGMVDEVDSVLGDVKVFAKDLRNADISSKVAKLDTAIDNVNYILADVRSDNGTLGKLLHDSALYTNINTTVISADSLLVDLKAHPKRYVHFSLFGKKDK